MTNIKSGEHNQSVAWQRTSNAPAQHIEAPFRRREMIAVDDPHGKPGKTRLHLSLHRDDDGRQPIRGVWRTSAATTCREAA
jgi:hypothetical protein